MVFLIPAIVDVANISLTGYANLLVFLAIVLAGFYYEWAIGLLSWLPTKVTSSDRSSLNLLPVFVVGSECSGVFVFLALVIAFSLLLNQLTNLIYRVINLAGLSLISVGTWAYFTDLTFLYIVYILAFTGAVVMLFLSVILMLPASVTAGNQNVLILVSLQPAHDDCIIFNIGLFATSFMATLLMIKIVQWLWPVLSFQNARDWWRSACAFKLPGFVETSLFVKNLPFLIKGITGIGAPTDVYGAFTKNSQNIQALPLLAHIGLYWQNTLYYIYVNVESGLYNGMSKDMYKFTAPVWGRLFMVLEYSYAPAKSYRQSLFPIPDIRRSYRPANLRYSLFAFLPYTLPVIVIKYLRSNSALSRLANRVFFIINLLIHFIVNIVFNIFAYIYIYDYFDLGALKQTLVVVSTTLIATPFRYSSNASLWDGLVCVNGWFALDSLVAIKEILY